jgi:thermostable 8-oxoguanine DNA glycosylase
VTCCALSNVPGGNDAADKIRVRILTALPGVGVGVASAILALSDPYNYGVVDGAVWSALFGGTDKNSFTVNDYVRYLKRLRTYARELGWPAQEVDFFVWMHRQERTGT